VRPPVIGLTGFRRDLPTYLGERTDLYTLDPGYADGVTRAGGLPLIIPHNDDPAQVLDLLDGLVLTGGGDLHPEHYGATAEVELDDPNAGADRWELALARGARVVQLHEQRETLEDLFLRDALKGKSPPQEAG